MPLSQGLRKDIDKSVRSRAIARRVELWQFVVDLGITKHADIYVQHVPKTAAMTLNEDRWLHFVVASDLRGDRRGRAKVLGQRRCSISFTR